MDLRLQKITKCFGDRVAVQIDAMVIRSGEFFCLVGPSGCGKTTTLNLIAGLEQPTSGRLYLGEHVLNELPPHKRDIAFVFQSYALYPHRTVSGNMAFPLEIAKLPKKVIRERVAEAAELLGLSRLLDRHPRQLSGGERQRVALGRAIVRQPRLFLLDEPLSNLDAPLRAQMRKELKQLHRRLGITFIYVTHDQDEALALSDRIAVMRDGRVQQCGDPDEIYQAPANTFVASFFGMPSINFLEGRLQQDGNACQLLVLDQAFPLGRSGEPISGASAMRIGIRPEDLVVSPTAIADSWAGRVSVVELHGSQCYLEIEVNGHYLTAVMPAQEARQVNESLWIAPRRLHVFSQETAERLATIEPSV